MAQEAPRLLTEISTFRQNGTDLPVMIETPQGSRNKLDDESEFGVFELSGVLPEGSVFPYDFGFVPSTLGEDGDPIEVVVLWDESVSVGCFVTARLIEVMEAQQTEREGQTTRNDWLLTVTMQAHTQAHVPTLEDLRPPMVDEIEHFFRSYNQTKRGTFQPTGRGRPGTRAFALV